MAIFPSEVLIAFFKQIFASKDDVEALKLGQGAGVIARTTKALLDADLAYPANTPAMVTNDADPDNNTFFIKVGASGSGTWQRSDWVLGTVGQKSYFDKIVGEAANDAEQAALEAAHYRFIIRTDQIASYVPPSLPPTGTITMQVIADILPTGTITMVIQ